MLSFGAAVNDVRHHCRHVVMSVYRHLVTTDQISQDNSIEAPILNQVAFTTGKNIEKTNNVVSDVYQSGGLQK